MKIVREKLPPRRRSTTIKAQLVFKARVDLEPSAHSFFVTVGFYPDGRKAEIFVKGAQDLESVMAKILEDAAVLISNLMQLGCSLEEIRTKIGRMRPGEIDASIVGALISAAAQIPDEIPMEAVSRWVNGEMPTPVLKRQVLADLGFVR